MFVKEVIIKCDSCNTINDKDAKYCKECGKKGEKEDDFFHPTEYVIKSQRCKKCGDLLFGNTCISCRPLEIYSNSEA